MIAEMSSSTARMPTRATPQSAGMDLYASVATVVPARGRVLVQTHVRVVIPEGHYLRIASRSGLSLKYGIEVGAGVIDRDYRGNIGAILYNHSDEDFEVRVGERIAQAILERCSYEDAVAIHHTLPLPYDDTSRGDGGFGSTGIL